ncbi:MarR family winged helix-turn-helix transcriptional regulator [Paenibacillus montanisoli]|uniref:MarR family transcriptional regulator n=1 Tax=Paenibacillus montanisoli TaxID=2081970 RepID=A0A328U281_9BACL|nr:MarR family transcriptional regulator [Paenibacillus montanisoli]RAP74104.1 MarR family transcriptional regulator [Paenibacillus montanisoli]
MKGDHLHNNSTASELIRVMRQLRNIAWNNRRPIENCTPAETMTLFCIGRGMCAHPDGLKASELSAMMNVASPTITQTVNVLTARGLLERSADPSDRRVVRIKLTEEGARLTQLAREAMHAKMTALIGYLGDDRAKLLVELLDDVYAFYQGEDSDETQSTTTKEGE